MKQENDISAWIIRNSGHIVFWNAGTAYALDKVEKRPKYLTEIRIEDLERIAEQRAFEKIEQEKLDFPALLNIVGNI